jgi:serine protease
MVASIIGSETDNGIGYAGIAYRARILPVRVLDSEGNGDATAIARGIRFATRRGAQVMNLSLEFPEEYTAKDVPQLLDALKYARKRGVLVVVAAGNAGLDKVPYPGRASTVMAVGAVTQHGCLAEYSNFGRQIDIVAPGGGKDGEFSDEGCEPLRPQGKGITQLSLIGETHTRLAPTVRSGTSMASPQVAAAAGAVIASGVLGRKPTPAKIQQLLQKTARDLGPKGYDKRYGHGLLDMGAATTLRATPTTP